MCLYSNELKAKKAKENIKAYKVYMKSKNGKYLPPFNNILIKPLSLNKNEIVKGRFKAFKKLWKWALKKEGGNGSKFLYIDKYCMEDGFIHTYTNKYTCICEMERYIAMSQLSESTFLPALVMFEVEIPKGTYYYENYSGETLCSRKIRIVKQIE